MQPPDSLEDETSSPRPQRPQESLPYRKTSRLRWFAIGLVALAVLVVGDVIQALRLSHPSSASPPAASATLAVAKPTSAPTVDIRPTSGPVRLGAPLGPFVAQFGHATGVGGGEYTFQHATLRVLIDSNQRILSIIDNAGRQRWNETMARNTCLAFAPPDAHYVRQITMLDDANQPLAVQFVYSSRTLASEFSASEFNDENGDPTTPGIFGIVIAYPSGSTSSFVACSIQVGLQETQGAQTIRPGLSLSWA